MTSHDVEPVVLDAAAERDQPVRLDRRLERHRPNTQAFGERRPGRGRRPRLPHEPRQHRITNTGQRQRTSTLEQRRTAPARRTRAGSDDDSGRRLPLASLPYPGRGCRLLRLPMRVCSGCPTQASVVPGFVAQGIRMPRTRCPCATRGTRGSAGLLASQERQSVRPPERRTPRHCQTRLAAEG